MFTRALLATILFSVVCIADEPAKPKGKSAEAKKVEVGKNVVFEVTPDGKRRVVVEATVSMREGPLEMFMCRKATKEHESVVSGDMDARDVHKALLLAGGVAGSPVKFEPKYEPARGSVINISVRYKDGDKEKTIDARSWVRDAKTQKELDKDWVFGGSFIFSPEHDPNKKLYAANGGEVVCVSNFSTAMIDVPIRSSDQDDERVFEAFKERIPPLGTKVTIIFEPQPEKKEAKPPEKGN